MRREASYSDQRQYIMNYLEKHGHYAKTPVEQDTINKGIDMYLDYNGIDLSGKSGYYRKFLDKQLERIDQVDLKAYFISFPVISALVNLLIIYENRDLTDDEKNTLSSLFISLYESEGSLDKYIPAYEAAEALGLVDG